MTTKTAPRSEAIEQLLRLIPGATNEELGNLLDVFGRETLSNFLVHDSLPSTEEEKNKFPPEHWR